MKTIQMTIDETLIEQVDRVVRELDTTRSAFIREALEQALKTHRLNELSRLDEEGYQRLPSRVEESDEWATVQDWGDEWNAAK